MKKILLLLTILFLPINVWAYSNFIIPGGNTLGIEVDTNGVMIIGFYKIDGRYNKGKNELKEGDYITHVNGEEVFSVEDMTKVIELAPDKRSVDITFTRKGETKSTILPLILSNGKYKTGLYVKGSIKGIGTLTYVDPNSQIYGALGHEIIESESNSIVEIKSGIIFENSITGIAKSKPGTPGSKLAKFNAENEYGKVFKNTRFGIFGRYEEDLTSDELLEVGTPKVGSAIIRTVIDEQKIEEFEIEITSVNETSMIKNISLRITDERLLDVSGGVVQGMSGSPIIQDGKIVGALTHVIIDNPVSGYGILITKMLEAGEK